MKCEEVRGLLAAEIYGDNTPEERQVLSAHLMACPACRQLEVAWRQAAAQALPPALPQKDAFWIRQKASIMDRLPRTRNAWPAWHRLAGPVVALSLLVSVWGWHRQQERNAFRIAQNMDLLKNMDMIQQLDVVENLDVLEAT